MSVSDEAVEAAYDVSQHLLIATAEIELILTAAAPFIAAQAWDEGHESGFWNGRESAGSGDMELCGIEHAKANNPYKSGTQYVPEHMRGTDNATGVKAILAKLKRDTP